MPVRAGQIVIDIDAGTAKMIYNLNAGKAALREFGQEAHGSVSGVQAISASLRVAEGNMTNNLRAAERWLASIPGAKTWLFLVRTEDVNGNHGPDGLCPMRDLYFFGAQGTRSISTTQPMLSTDSTLEADATNAPIVVTMLPFSSIPNQKLRLMKVDTSTNGVTLQTASSSDTFNGGLTSQTVTNPGDAIEVEVNG